MMKGLINCYGDDIGDEMFIPKPLDVVNNKFTGEFIGDITHVTDAESTDTRLNITGDWVITALDVNELKDIMDQYKETEKHVDLYDAVMMCSMDKTSFYKNYGKR